MLLKFIGIIPTRYASTRSSGKPLADLDGKPVIQHVYEQAKKCLGMVWVATDDTRIEKVVKDFGGNVVLTSKKNRSRTERCYEAYTKVGKGYNVVINLQDDEPFILPSQIEKMKTCFIDYGVHIATLVKPFNSNENFAMDLYNKNAPKVVINKNNEAMFFSRAVIPFYRSKSHTEWLASHTYYKHIEQYAYRAEVLQEITHLPPSPLEKAESLEQLRWLENGYKIKVVIAEEEMTASQKVRNYQENHS
ncbi:3-deoxy-manno-octulosonate cytidylyltransferase (CMP-KDO synthetase) [Parabacteroides sp. PF5-5]|uniref:3-deoxy-manno-octulosonate cytidylyltransferase n=1 Tax=unclassified Parabacteroides TaxID=2649774 RepID=UPI002474F8CF|nr:MULTISPECIES: 3-deoxy-manno-octulosonate cytidylyltransferase [unclassified Parabacteroides]MDH6304486.1 3-deoxy-manno-octulosonate cytidylyltransferase (CMP-KDO synthetase) [Parabacteroides sp. PH5-39]MDH6315361.1 3-deoxy-manno-octulosonate cytidylyltransferase (CMP-KDO synthetase) [Parabacteroides sp. PF5-13]MDH6319145.1 3-deoxy-manno-octulosonate cytidylyltransferase (CMP-KDO synthetase) [Parabacteroides sp. PH5-13]MDH6322875.1 3-deoxy-manno-octulosonate cytidylyltransferase (CMP-KDO synt